MLEYYYLLLLFNILGSCLIFLGFVKYLCVCVLFSGLCIVCRGFVMSIGASPPRAPRRAARAPPPPRPLGGRDYVSSQTRHWSSWGRDPHTPNPGLREPTILTAHGIIIFINVS